MKDKNLLFTRAYEQAVAQDAASEIKPVFHLAPYIGWLNDPNGFSFYQGQYHLFYQYNPYSTEWDSMHWGHAVSRDLLRWTHLPAFPAAPSNFPMGNTCCSIPGCGRRAAARPSRPSAWRLETDWTIRNTPAIL